MEFCPRARFRQTTPGKGNRRSCVWAVYWLRRRKNKEGAPAVTTVTFTEEFVPRVNTRQVRKFSVASSAHAYGTTPVEEMKKALGNPLNRILSKVRNTPGTS